MNKPDLEFPKLNDSQKLVYAYFNNIMSTIKIDTKAIDAEFINAQLETIEKNLWVDVKTVRKALVSDYLNIIKGV